MVAAVITPIERRGRTIVECDDDAAGSVWSASC